MTRPLWFQLIERWVPEGMGTTGITLPFLAGGLAHAHGGRLTASQILRGLLDQMVRAPVSGFVVEVRQCHNIDDLVLSVSPTEQALPFNGCVLLGSNQAHALGYSQDAQSAFGGLDSSDPEICRQRLIERAEPHCASGQYSRLRDEATGEFIFGPPTLDEIAYIERQVKALESKT